MPRETRSRRRLTRKSFASRMQQVLNRTTKLLMRGALTRALEILSVAVVQHPDNPAIVTRHADALYQSGRITEARDAYRRACALDKMEFQAWYGCGCAELSCGAYGRAIHCFRRASALHPEDMDTHRYLGRALFELGEVDAALAQFFAVTRSKNPDERRSALRSIAIIIPGSSTRGNAAILKSRCDWATVEEAVEGPPRVPGVRRRKHGEKLRIGYVSAFFNSRNWMKPVWGVINGHDRAAFEIHLFLDSGNPDAENGYRRHPHDRIYLTDGLSNEKLAERIAAARIDVLVDVNGYSAANRLSVFMRKPAPVVLAWFAMYATTGMRAFDYIVGDASVVPPGEERFYTERVLRVSGSYIASSPLYDVPRVEEPPCLRTGQITFGCLAPQYKITDEVIASWSRILKGAQNARLFLKTSCMDEASNREALYSRFARHGVTQEQLEVEGPAEYYEFLVRYGRVDIALDTFPYNGGTTTFDSLWQGVPVLTFNGDRWVGRNSLSLLVAAGLGDWAMPSLEAYVKRGIQLATSPDTPDHLVVLRARLREHLLASPACDTTALCRELERHYFAIARPSREKPCPLQAGAAPSHQVHL